MRLKWKHVHLSLAFGWVAALIVLAANLALLGNETARLGKQWGMEENRERELNYELGKIRQQIEWKASEGYIEQKVRTMRLPLIQRNQSGLLARQP